MPSVDEVAQSAASAVAGTNGRRLSLEGYAEDAFIPAIDQQQNEVQRLLKELQDRTTILEDLETLSQSIRLASGDMDWSGDEEMKRLIDLAKELGTKLPDGYVWTADQASACLEGIKGTVNKLSNMSTKTQHDIKTKMDHISELWMLLKSIISKLDETKKFMLQR